MTKLGHLCGRGRSSRYFEVAVNAGSIYNADCQALQPTSWTLPASVFGCMHFSRNQLHEGTKASAIVKGKVRCTGFDVETMILRHPSYKLRRQQLRRVA